MPRPTMHDRISQVNAWRTVKFTRLICTPLKLSKSTSKVSVQFPCSNLDTTQVDAVTEWCTACSLAERRQHDATVHACE
eukprot:1914273-Pleurochrysis_carterae.AAC.1